MNTLSESFGRRLQIERERRGIPLSSIAASTKIKESLLAGLERDDVSKWPQGIFRRAFLREYAVSIGLAPEPVVAEFVRLFPEDHAGAPVRRAFSQPPELRLTLADGGRTPLHSVAARVGSATVEACAILGAAQVLTWATGFNFWTVCATASMTYYGLASACWERTPLSRWLQRDRQAVAASDDSERSDSRGVLELLVQRAGLETYTPGARADAVDVVTGS
jgi:transcriptional regulator with XRE-family HTH domain